MLKFLKVKRERLQFEYLVEEFESATSQRGSQAIAEFMGRVPQAHWRKELLFEVLSIDFGEVIRHGHDLDGICLTACYRRDLEELHVADFFRRTACMEFELRSREGDRPRVGDFAGWARDENLRKCPALYEIINSVQPMTLLVRSKSSPCQEFAMDRPTTLGRWTRQDPCSHFAVDGQPCRYIVVSDSRYVSRQQALIVRPSVSRIQVSNIGSRLPLIIENVGTIPPGESYEATVVRSIEFYGTRLSLLLN